MCQAKHIHTCIHAYSKQLKVETGQLEILELSKKRKWEESKYYV